MNNLARVHRVIAFSLPLAALACGGSALQLNDVTPQAVPALQSQHAQSPQDQVVLTRLGVAYFRANRLPEARAAFDSVAARDPQNGIAAVYRGMTAEAQGDFPAARSSYESFIAVARSRDLKSMARQRLALVGRRELEFSARQALAQEAQLSTTPPEPNTIAVMPFAYAGSNEDIKPLSRGFAQLVVTDLAKSRQVRVLERERMQAMLDEMHLGAARVDSSTAARSGRLLRAARVVEGSLQDQGNVLRADATVVDVSTTGVSSPANAALELSRVFDMEKALVLDLFRTMGISLTPAERGALDQRPTQSLQAFLSWSRGLEAEDRGDFAGAQGFYDQAARLDPGFLSAQQSSAKASDMSAAASASVQTVDAAVQQNASTETGQTGSASTGQALSNGASGTTPPATSSPSGGGTTTSSQQPTTTSNSPPPATQPGITQTGTIHIVLPRP
ncbi:MAG: tetratricopeptide repeat protein [Gemmatimonadales bacterium]